VSPCRHGFFLGSVGDQHGAALDQLRLPGDSPLAQRRHRPLQRLLRPGPGDAVQVHVEQAVQERCGAASPPPPPPPAPARWRRGCSGVQVHVNKQSGDAMSDGGCGVQVDHEQTTRGRCVKPRLGLAPFIGSAVFGGATLNHLGVRRLLKLRDGIQLGVHPGCRGAD